LVAEWNITLVGKKGHVNYLITTGFNKNFNVRMKILDKNTAVVTPAEI
jgi:hypothetical protein